MEFQVGWHSSPWKHLPRKVSKKTQEAFIASYRGLLDNKRKDELPADESLERVSDENLEGEGVQVRTSWDFSTIEKARPTPPLSPGLHQSRPGQFPPSIIHGTRSSGSDGEDTEGAVEGSQQKPLGNPS